MLSVFRLASVRAWPCAGEMVPALRSHFVGRVLALPVALPRAEREETIDALATLLDLPVRAIASLDGAPRPAHPGEILVLPALVEAEPAPVPGAVVVCSIHSSPPYLDPPQDLFLLRDAIRQCWGAQHSGTRLQEVAVWLGQATDSPATALHFADGALGRSLTSSQADDATLYLAGLAAAVGWLLRGVETRVVEWLLVRAFDAVDRGRLVGTAAAELGEERALRLAFEAGLVLTLPDGPEEPLDLRRPLGALGALEEAPGRPSVGAAAEALLPELGARVSAVLQRLQRTAKKGLGLEGPSPPKVLVGREDVLRRLTTLCEPAREVRTTVLVGPPGSGKSAVAASLGQRLRSRLEPVWVRFDSGPERGWLPVASALGVPTGEAGTAEDRALVEFSGGVGGAALRDPVGVPFWVHEVHRRLREGGYLVVVEGLKEVAEEDLPRWLPTGTGRCSVLVLSETAQRSLQRMHDAVVMRLPWLPVEAARQMLAARVPQHAETIRSGLADGLITEALGQPAVLLRIGDLLEGATIEAVARQIAAGEVDLSEVIRSTIDELDPREERVLMALLVSAPQGSPPVLPIRVAGGADASDRLENLLDRGLAERVGRLVRLRGDMAETFQSSRSASSADDDSGDLWYGLIARHAQETLSVLEEAVGAGELTLHEDLYNDILLAVERLSVPAVRRGETELSLLLALCDALSQHPRSDRDETLDRRVAGYRAALSSLSREDDLGRWVAAQFNLADARRKQAGVSDDAALREAIQLLEEVLGAVSKEHQRRLWAAVQVNLGNCLSLLHIVLQRSQSVASEELLARAVEAYHAALTVLTREQDGEVWASAHANIGRSLLELTAADHVDRLPDVLVAYHAAMTTFTREEMPAKWGGLQLNLGDALVASANLEDEPAARTRKLREAVAAFDAVLSAPGTERHPDVRTAALIKLGSALLLLDDGSRAENVRRAIECYRVALSALSPEAEPERWTEVQIDLGSALTLLPSGDRAENLRTAIESYRAALALLTPERWPTTHARAQHALDEALRELAALEAGESSNPSAR